MVDLSMLDDTTEGPVPTNPHEIALHSLCKVLIQSRFFRGFYVERRYVDSVEGYRDIISLQQSEKSLDKILKDIRDKLQLFYSHQNPQMWIGITSGPLTGITTAQPAALETHLWVEIKDLAFGQYWFSIKTIRFRNNEVILKLKEIQAVEDEETSYWARGTTSHKNMTDESHESVDTLEDSTQTSPATTSTLKYQITIADFMILLQQWWNTIKQTVYDFMSQDISKDNIKGVLKFLGLLIVSTLLGVIEGLKLLGTFTLRFNFEFCRLVHVLTPIILKIIEVLSKIIGGLYILLAMIWRDTVGNRNQPSIEYNRPMYNTIRNVRQRRHKGFERKINI